jgi:hypothetical protein
VIVYLTCGMGPEGALLTKICAFLVRMRDVESIIFYQFKTLNVFLCLSGKIHLARYMM